MTRSTGKNRPIMHKVHEPRVSPDDVQVLIIERDRLAASDTRTAATPPASQHVIP